MKKIVHVVLDFEMNPVAAEHRNKEVKRGEPRLASELIEIGALKLSETYETIGEFEALIHPALNAKVEGNITKLTGLTMEDLAEARSFGEVLADFAAWVGEEPVRIYSWSQSDLHQLQSECLFKGVKFPDNLSDWQDFQAMFPRITEINLQRQMSLESAAEMAGVNFDNDRAHRAMYDARVTAELVQLVLSGRYREQMAKVRNVIKPEVEVSTFSLGDKFGAQLAALFKEDETQ